LDTGKKLDLVFSCIQFPTNPCPHKVDNTLLLQQIESFCKQLDNSETFNEFTESQGNSIVRSVCSALAKYLYGNKIDIPNKSQLVPHKEMSSINLTKKSNPSTLSTYPPNLQPTVKIPPEITTSPLTKKDVSTPPSAHLPRPSPTPPQSIVSIKAKRSHLPNSSTLESGGFCNISVPDDPTLIIHNIQNTSTNSRYMSFYIDSRKKHMGFARVQTVAIKHTVNKRNYITNTLSLTKEEYLEKLSNINSSESVQAINVSTKY